MGQTCSTGCSTDRSICNGKTKNLFEPFGNNDLIYHHQQQHNNSEDNYYYCHDNDDEIVRFDSGRSLATTSPSSFDYSPRKQFSVKNNENTKIRNGIIAPSNTFDTEETTPLDYDDDEDSSTSSSVNNERQDYESDNKDCANNLSTKAAVAKTALPVASTIKTATIHKSLFPFSPSPSKSVVSEGEMQQDKSLASSTPIPRKIIFSPVVYTFGEKSTDSSAGTKKEKDNDKGVGGLVEISSNIQREGDKNINNIIDHDLFSSPTSRNTDTPTTDAKEDETTTTSSENLETATRASSFSCLSSIILWPLYLATTTTAGTIATETTTTAGNQKDTASTMTLTVKANPPVSSLSSSFWPLSSMVGQFCYKSCTCLFFNNSSLLYSSSNATATATATTTTEKNKISSYSSLLRFPSFLQLQQQQQQRSETASLLSTIYLQQQV